jgi:hypothetical protein
MVICIGLILIKMLTMDLDRSKQQIELRRLTQKLALLEEMRCSGEPSSTEEGSLQPGSPTKGKSK